MSLLGTRRSRGKRHSLAAIYGASAYLFAALGAPVHGATDSPGTRLSVEDATLEYRTLQQALETHLSGELAEWRNARNGNHGFVRPVRTYKTKSGVFCREFEEYFYVGGRSDLQRGAACRTASGDWQVVISPGKKR